MKYKLDFKKFSVLVLVIMFSFVLCLPAQASTPSRVLRSGNGIQKALTLTFDAGSDAGHTLQILNILKNRNVKATFFLTGKWLQNNPDLARRIIAEGHEVGNHSYSHPDFAVISREQMKRELNRTDELAKNYLGSSLQPFFRPPFGSYTKDSLVVLGELGYKWTVMWTVDTLDWKGIPASKIVERVMQGGGPGGIILMHVGSGTQTPQALPVIIDRLRSYGYKMVRLSELISPPGLVHTVAAGEMLYSIGRVYGVTPWLIADANGLKNLNLIYPGQQLIIPKHYVMHKYTVVKGDTLWSLARMFGSSVAGIKQVNGIKDNIIWIGQKLSIPVEVERVYYVQRGDTLWSISQRYGTTVEGIKKANGIPVSTIYAGQKIIIPFI